MGGIKSGFIIAIGSEGKCKVFIWWEVGSQLLLHSAISIRFRRANVMDFSTTAPVESQK